MLSGVPACALTLCGRLAWRAPAQGLQFWGVLSELEQLKKVPDVTADGWKQLAPGDSLSFGSHAWNVSLDPTSGDNSAWAAIACCRLRSRPASYLSMFSMALQDGGSWC